MLSHLKRAVLGFRTLVILGLSLPAPAAADLCWKVTPPHGALGVPGTSEAATLWDIDGIGPQPPRLVVASDVIQYWDGSDWYQIGGAPNGPVRALAVYGGSLYAAGAFSAIGGDVVRYLARWNGSNWVTLGAGLTTGPNSQEVSCLEVFNGRLYVGGLYYRVDTGTYHTVSAWDGASWINVPQTQAWIADFTVLGGQLYAGTLPTVPGIYRLDAEWTRLGTLADKGVRALAVHGGSLYAGGDFRHFFTGVDMNGIARWNGTAWVPVGSGVGPGNASVNSLTLYLGNLIAGGKFTTMNGVTVNNVASWNGASWSALGTGVTLSSGVVEDLIQFDSQLAVLGDINTAGGNPAPNIARWDGSRWLPFLEGINDQVRSMFATGALYVGGNFSFRLNGGSYDRVFRSDGVTISSLSSLGGQQGTNGPAYAFGVHNFSKTSSSLILGGSFSYAAGVAASNIASYSFDFTDGWAAMGSGLNSSVYGVASYNGSIYAAGTFTGSGATPLPHLARWSGAGGWVDPGFGSFLDLYAMQVSAGELLIGGVPGGSGVTIWNGATFSHTVANGPVTAFTRFNGDIIAGGQFTTIGGQTAQRVARRAASTGQWHPMGEGFDNPVYALAVHGGVLYAGGVFANSGATAVNYIAQWNGSAWVPVQGGLDGPVYALASFKNALHVGGDFQRSLDGVHSPYWIADSACVVPVAVEPGAPRGGVSLGSAYPNPSRDGTQIDFTLPQPGHVRLVIYDVAGRLVRTLADRRFEAGNWKEHWDGRDDAGRSSPTGMYFYRLQTEHATLSKQAVLLK